MNERVKRRNSGRSGGAGTIPAAGRDKSECPALEAIGLVKSFGGLKATNNVSIHAKTGESVGIIGPNGAGKTTLLNLLTREIDMDAGSIFLEGMRIDQLPVHSRVKAGLARTYQIPAPFGELTVQENIRVGMMPDDLWQMLFAGADENTEQEVAESVGLGGKRFRGLPRELAMGDLRRLELARTLATQPKVLLLDEVFAGLTVREIEQISGLLMKRRQTHNTTYLIVSHDLKALEPLVDRVIVINFGEVMAQGTFRQVVSDKDVQDAYLGTGQERAT